MLKLLNLTLFFVNALDKYLFFSYLRLNLYYNFKTTKKMKTKNEQLKDLKEVKKLFYKAYLLQNSAKCILSQHFKIDIEDKYLENDFFKVYKINASTGLYESEIATQNLIDKINNTII